MTILLMLFPFNISNRSTFLHVHCYYTSSSQCPLVPGAVIAQLLTTEFNKVKQPFIPLMDSVGQGSRPGMMGDSHLLHGALVWSLSSSHRLFPPGVSPYVSFHRVEAGSQDERMRIWGVVRRLKVGRRKLVTFLTSRRAKHFHFPTFHFFRAGQPSFSPITIYLLCASCTSTHLSSHPLPAITTLLSMFMNAGQ